MSSRVIATRIIKQVIEDKITLSNIFNDKNILKLAGNEKGLIQEMTYGSIRWYQQLEYILEQLLDKPIKAKDTELKYLLIAGLYQLKYMNIAPHAVVSETVETCIKLKKKSAKGLVNAVLRGYLRKADDIELTLNKINVRNSHPDWLVDLIKLDWPDQWQTILEANNQYPPMYLRVNQLMINRESYLNKLNDSDINAIITPYSDCGILLEKPVDVHALPGFDSGLVSVQDLAAQLTVSMLNLHPGQHVLDACAAPGGKSSQILESEPELGTLLLLEKDQFRANKLSSTMKRLRLKTNIKVTDATDIDSWWDGNLFDRILIDAPCSATGVIRRHPDIKLIRNIEDIDNINEQQMSLLSTIWQTLKSKGLLLYVTCSILKQENSKTIKKFIDEHTDCKIKPIISDWGVDTGYGKQILTGDNNMDGFFYACLEKQ